MTPEIIYKNLIGYPDRELGEEQPAKSLMAINQTQDAEGNYLYGFDLHRMFYNSGDITNWFDERDNGDEIFGCFYLGTSLRTENSLVDELDYFFQLVFKIPEDLRDKFQVFFDDYIKAQIGNNFTNDDHTKEYTVEFTNGANPSYSEKADDDGKDFLLDIVITVVETDPINKFNDVKFFIEYTDDNGNTVRDRVKYTSYTENRQTNVESQTTTTETENIYWASSSDFDIGFAIPAIRGNKFVDIIDMYRNQGRLIGFKLIKQNATNILDTFEKSFAINQCTVNTTGIGPIVYSVMLKRIK